MRKQLRLVLPRDLNTDASTHAKTWRMYAELVSSSLWRSRRQLQQLRGRGKMGKMKGKMYKMERMNILMMITFQCNKITCNKIQHVLFCK